LFNINLAGGSILDVGVYPVSFSRLIAGIVSGKSFLNPYKIDGTATIGKTKVDEIAYAKLYFNNNIIANTSAAIRKNMDDVAIVKGTKGFISLTNPWTPGKDGGPYKSSIIVNIEGHQEIIEIEVQKHLFAFEAEVASKAIIEKRNEALSPAMTWNDTLGNLETLDIWRKEVDYKLPQEIN
jgi:predicted dehydrogenase